MISLNNGAPITQNILTNNFNYNLLEKIKSDIAFLKKASSENFRNITIEELLEFSKKKKEYQQEFKHSTLKQEFEEFRDLYKKSRQTLLPFRIVDYVKQGGYLKIDHPNPNLPKEDKKIAFKKWEAKLLSSLKNEVWELASKINWLHGTNSAILPFLPKTDFCLIPTGKLLEKGIAPMSGEIKKGGMKANGINQTRLSAVTVSEMSVCWDYASRISHTFFHLYLDKHPETFFCTHLGKLERMTPQNDDWDSTIISLYQLKQWSPETFQKLVEKYADWIERVKGKSTANFSEKEIRELDVVDYDQNKLAQARTDEDIWKEIAKAYLEVYPYGKNTSQEDWLQRLPTLSGLKHVDSVLAEYFTHRWRKIILFKMFYKEMADEELESEKNEAEIIELKKIQAGDLSSILDPIRAEYHKRIKRNAAPYAKRLERLEKLFEKKFTIKFSDDDKNELTKPFPIIIASTTSKASAAHAHGKEYHVIQPKFGKDIDIVFVPKNSLTKMQKWVAEQGLNKKISIYSTDVFEEMMRMPLIHSPQQISLNRSYLNDNDVEKIHKIINEEILKLYKVPYINGQPRHWHGVPHALRVLLFAHVIGSVYKEAGHSFAKSENGHLQIAAALHDCARENDGVDLWDKQSGTKCKEILLKNGVDESEAHLFEKAIAEKDNNSVDSLEQKVIHDADCLDIIRCLKKEEDFDPSKLWILKDIDSDQIVHELISEAKLLIKLTDTNKEIKDYIETSKDPLTCLYQIVFHINKIYGKLEMIAEHTYGTMRYFCGKDYLLNEKIEKEIKNSLSK